MATSENSVAQTRVTFEMTKGECSDTPTNPPLRDSETSNSQSFDNFSLDKAAEQTKLTNHIQTKYHSESPTGTISLERERDATDSGVPPKPRTPLKDALNLSKLAENTATQSVRAGNWKDFDAWRDPTGQLTQPKGTLTDYDTDGGYLSKTNPSQHLHGRSSSKPTNLSLSEDSAKTYSVATSPSVTHRSPGQKGFPPLPTITEHNDFAPSDLGASPQEKERKSYVLPHLRTPEKKDIAVNPTSGGAQINKLDYPKLTKRVEQLSMPNQVESEDKDLPHLRLPQAKSSSYQKNGCLGATIGTAQKGASLFKTHPSEALAASVDSPVYNKTDVVCNVTNVSSPRPSKHFLGEHLLPTGKARSQQLASHQTTVEKPQSGPAGSEKEIMYPPTYPADSMKPEQSMPVSFVSGAHLKKETPNDASSPDALDQGQPAPLSADGNEGSNKAHPLPALSVLSAIQSPARQNSLSSSVDSIAGQCSDPSARVSELSAELDFEQHWQGRNASERSEVVFVEKKQEPDDRFFEIIDDTQLEHQLAGWDGNFQPPPIEWNDRDMYNRKKAEHIEGIKRWVLARRQAHIMSPCLLQTVDNEAYTSGYALAIGETNFAEAPDEMAHFTIRNEDPFSMAHMDQTAAQSAQNFAARKKGMDERKNAAREEKQARRRELKRGPIKLPPNPHKPKANIYIRLAQPHDMGPVSHIYNYYVRRSVVVEELEPTEVRQWREILRQTLNDKFAFFVAVMKGGKGVQQGLEEVVGFAYAEPHTLEEQSSFGYFCEMQVYVSAFDELHIHQGIGKSLVDRVLWSLDSTYHYRNGCAFVCDPKIRASYECGGNLIQKNIMIKVPFDADDDSEFQWIKKWLESFEFVHTGTLPRVGRKLNKQ